MKWLCSGFEYVKGTWIWFEFGRKNGAEIRKEVCLKLGRVYMSKIGLRFEPKTEIMREGAVDFWNK